MAKKLAITAAVVFIFSSAFAAEYGGITGAPYLNIGMGARPSGMGEAYTAVVDNVDSTWWNPGALVKVENPQFGLMHNQNFGGTAYEYLAIGFPAEQLGLDIWGTIGITALLVRVDDVEQTKEEPDGSGGWKYSLAQESRKETYGAGGTVLGVSYSWQAAKMLAVGATIKVINQKVALEEGWIPALDIGILSNTNVKGFDIGVVFQNVSFMQLNSLGKEAPDAPLPLNLKFGLAYKLPRLFTPENDPRDKFVFAMDAILPLKPANMPFRLHVGMEYGINLGDNFLKPRVGYRFNGQGFISDLGALAGLTAGFGLSRNFEGVDVALDYAFIPYGILGSSHRVGLTINVGQPTATPTPMAKKPPKVVKLKPEKKKIWVMWSVDSKEKDKVKGYNVYMSYKPGGQYFKLSKAPVPATKYFLKVGPLKSGLRCYFVVTTVGKDDKESPYSKEISAVPR